MKKIIRSGSFILVFALFALLLNITVSADSLIDNARTYNGVINVKGALDSSYANKEVTLLLLNEGADINNLSKDDIAYVDQCKISTSGTYEISFKPFSKFVPARCRLYARVGTENVTNSVITAVSEENVLQMIDYSLVLNQDLSTATAMVNVDNIFNVQDDSIIEYMPILAFYNDDGTLLSVKRGEKNTSTLSTALPIGARTTRAFLWKTIDAQIPLDSAIKKEKKDNLNVLIIGNSFSVDGTFYLESIAKAAGVNMNVAVIQHGGSSPYEQWQFRDDSTTNYFNFEYVGGSSTSGVTLGYAFNQGIDWDYVLLQEWRPDKVAYENANGKAWQPYLNYLAKYVKEKCPSATLGLQMTWAFERGFDTCGGDTTDSQYANQLSMWQKSYEYNKKAAAEIGSYVWDDAGDTISSGGYPIMIVPSGYGIQYARNYMIDGVKKFDTLYDKTVFETETANNLENYKFHVSYDKLINADDAANGKIRLNRDGFHMSNYGRYLIGCVWFETLTGKSVIGNTFIPGAVSLDSAGTSNAIFIDYTALSQGDTTLIQNIVHAAVNNYNLGITINN